MYITKRLSVSLLLLAVFVIASAFSPAYQEGSSDEANLHITQVDTSQFPRVTVYVSVTDSAGEPVGVDAGSIVLEENGVPISPEQIGGVGAVGPLTTLLVMDISGSMRTAGKLQAAKNAALAYMEQMRANDSAGLLAFNTRISYPQEITSDRAALESAIVGLRAQDDTAMYDALIQGVDILEGVSGRKAIIVLTDGLDNRSSFTPEEVIERIGPEGLSISTIGLGDPNLGRGSLSALDEVALQELAAKAGGVYGYAEDEASLLALYQRYGRALQSEYVITYTSPATLRDGVNRALSVSLSDSSFGGAQSAVYNPGGLVPEIADPAPWPLFLGLLAGLLALLLIPLFIVRTASFVGSAGRSAGRSFSFGRRKARIKFKD